MTTTPRFENVSCSQCGGTFGPGEHGFSHCDNHQGMSMQTNSGHVAGGKSEPTPAEAPTQTFEFVCEWFGIAERNAKNAGKPDAALLWHDGLAQLRNMASQRDADARDAARYRWLRDKSDSGNLDLPYPVKRKCVDGQYIQFAFEPAELDAAIDAALAKAGANN